MDFTEAQIERYSRHIILKDIGGVGQSKILKSKVLIIGKGNLLTNRLFIFNALDMEFRTVKLKRNPKCPVCGDNPTITELQDYEQPICDSKNK